MLLKRFNDCHLPIVLDEYINKILIDNLMNTNTAFLCRIWNGKHSKIRTNNDTTGKRGKIKRIT